MIITKLIGGLGNQMFQYAGAVALAKKMNCSAYADISAFKTYKNHNGYQFNSIFKNHPLTASYFNAVPMLGTKGFKMHKIRCDIDHQYEYSPTDKIIRQNTHNFAPYFKQINRRCYISGFWQSEKYFIDAKQEVAKAFTFQAFEDAKNLKLKENIKSTPSAFIHIRRGDYVSNAAANEFHGICDATYYKQAIKKVMEIEENVNFYVFSDEPNEAKKVLGEGSEYTYVSHNSGMASHHDMHLMSLCKHHIIANSSFSWWGAWLGGHHNGLTIAPAKWFANSDEPITDIYCADWIKL